MATDSIEPVVTGAESLLKRLTGARGAPGQPIQDTYTRVADVLIT